MNTNTLGRTILARILGSDLYACAVLLILVVLLYAPSLNIWAHGDDFADLARAPESPLWNVLGPVHGDETSWQFRPLERLVNSINVSLLGYETTLFSHAVSLLGFMISVVMVFRLARLLEPDSRWYAMLASVFFAVSPTNVFSVIQIDTISQLYATVFSLLALWWLLSQHHRKPVVYHGVYFLFISLCLCSKTTSVGFVLAAPLAVYLLGGESFTHSRRGELRNLVVSYAGSAILMLLYVLFRLLNGIAFSETSGVYSLHFSTRILHNGLQLIGSIIYVGSSLDIFPNPQVVRIVPSAIFTIALLALTGIGLRHMIRTRGHKKTGQDAPHSEMDFESRHLTVFGLSLLILAGMFPIVLAGKASESYSYSFSPFYALLLALAAIHGFQAIRSSRSLKPYTSGIGIVLFLAVTVWLVYGTCEKVRLALDVSDRSKNYYHEAVRWLDSVPDTEVTLCWRDDQDLKETGAYGGFLVQELATVQDRLFPRRQTDAYSYFVVPDRVILRGPVSFASRFRSKPIDYVEESPSVELCDYEAFVGDDGLHIVPK